MQLSGVFKNLSEKHLPLTRRFRLLPGRKIRLIMKLTYFLLLACFCQVHASTYAQKVTLHEKNASLEHLIRNIERQSGYVFFLDYALLDPARKVSVDITGGTLQEAIDSCFQPFSLTYTILGKTIVVKQKAPEAADLVIKGVVGAISARTVTYDLERLMTGATLVSCSGFGQAAIAKM